MAMPSMECTLNWQIVIHENSCVASGILDDLAFIQRRGYNKVVIHMDSLEVVKALQDIYLADSSSTL
ncbi:hypothetical protein Gotur_006445, partial [Gossypium turneri]